MKNQISQLFGTIKSVIWSQETANKLLIVVIIAVGTWIVFKIIDKLLKRWFNQRVARETDGDKKRIITFEHITREVLRFTIVICGVMMILSQFINVGALLTVAGVGTIAIGLGAQKLVEDLLAGFMILSENQFCVGDYVSLENGNYGKVETISMRTTGIRQLDGSLYIIQNGQIGKVINFSKGITLIKIIIEVSYESDLNQVIEAMKVAGQRAYEDSHGFFVEMPEVIGVNGFASSGIEMSILGHIKAENKLRAEAVMRKSIKETFDEYNIEIPYDKLVLIEENPNKGEHDAAEH